MKILNYPHPTLRHKSKPLRRVDAELRETIREMFDAMYEAKGVGLAANQVDLPLRLFIVNLEADPAKGEELVFLNPVISRPKGSDEAEEGCLSLPGLYGPVRRPKQITIQAYDLAGREVTATARGLFGRVLQHEYDHLDGVLFTDRMTELGRAKLVPALEDFEAEFASRCRTGEISDVEQMATRLSEVEARYCG